jgi:hypothetical protein
MEPEFFTKSVHSFQVISMMKAKRQSEQLQVTEGFLVVDCTRQALLQCLTCRKKSMILVSSRHHQLRWCLYCATQLTLTSFDDKTGNPTIYRQKIAKWVDNGSVQFIQTPQQTLIITFREHQTLPVSHTK